MAEIFPPVPGAPAYGGFPITTGDEPSIYPNAIFLIVGAAGGGDPGAVGAGVLWSPPYSVPGQRLLYIRNEANDGWETFFSPNAATPDIEGVLTEGHNAQGQQLTNLSNLTSAIVQSASILPSGGVGNPGDTMVFNSGPQTTTWAGVQSGAGVPVAAPDGFQPLYIDTTPITGGLYVWDGAAWVQVSVFP